jgi:carboxymethylenebutenolidase
MTRENIDIQTSSGPMQTAIFKPEGAGPWPAVVVCMDAGGLREAIFEVAEHLAKRGFLAVVPDFYHALGDPLTLLPEAERSAPGAFWKIFADATIRTRFFREFFGPATDYKNVEQSLGAALEYLEASQQSNGKVGTTGYCMGGNISFRAATLFGARIRATASFHGGFLATDNPDSPHKRAADIKSRVYVAGAIEDVTFTDAAKQQLEAALSAAGVEHRVETYAAHHGFAVRDNPTYNAQAAERHYATLDSFFAETLR